MRWRLQLPELLLSRPERASDSGRPKGPALRPLVGLSAL